MKTRTLRGIYEIMEALIAKETLLTFPEFTEELENTH
jgi:hypothetical protein